MTIWGPDENRAIEAVAALLEIFPRIPGETDADLAQRMAQWAMQQGPNVRADAVHYAVSAMVAALPRKLMFMQLADIGMNALHEYNENRWGGM